MSWEILILDATDPNHRELGWYVSDELPPTADRDDACKYQSEAFALADAKAIEKCWGRIRTRVLPAR